MKEESSSCPTDASLKLCAPQCVTEQVCQHFICSRSATCCLFWVYLWFVAPRLKDFHAPEAVKSSIISQKVEVFSLLSLTLQPLRLILRPPGGLCTPVGSNRFWFPAQSLPLIVNTVLLHPFNVLILQVLSLFDVTIYDQKF